METLFQDTNFWVAISFVVFAFICYKYGREAALLNLDHYINEVRERIKSAEDLRAKAEAMVIDYEARHAAAALEAKKLLDEAAQRAQMLLEQGKAEQEARTKARQKQLDAELKQMEEQAVAELRAHMAKLVEEMALAQLKKELDGDTAQNGLIERSIEAARASQKAA